MPESIESAVQDNVSSPMNLGIIGNAQSCLKLLKVLDDEKMSRLGMEVLGIFSADPGDLKSNYPDKLKPYLIRSLEELFKIEDLNMIIELTGSKEIHDSIIKEKPPDISYIDYRAAKLLWDQPSLKERITDSENDQKHVKEILNSLPYRILVINMDKTIDTVNQTFLNDLKISDRDIQGKHCYEIKYDLDRPCSEAGRDCYIESKIKEIKEKGIYSTYKEVKNEENETRFDVVTIVPINDPDGNTVQLLEASRDVTDRIKLEKDVQKSNTFFQNVIQSTVDGIVVVDTEGNILIFNEGMERLTGYSASEVKHLTSFYPIDTAKENMKKMRSDQHGPMGKLNPTSMTVMTKSGEEIPVTLSASTISIDGREIGSVGVFTDMREVLQMRKDLEEAHLQLVQSEKIASVGRMAAGVAHEINNPLSGILIYAELLKDSVKDNPQHLEDSNEIIEQTLRCKKIVADLLEFSRQSVGAVKSLNIEALIEKSMNILINQAIFQDIKVIKDFDEEMPDMAGDIGQLQQVFTNLFINAADAMEGKGQLKIQARYEQEQGLFRIEITDTGPGVPEELREKIFDIFFSTKPVGKGTGLGLSISQNIIKLHGGSIIVECPPEGGTRFVLEFPMGFIGHPVDEPVFV